MSTNAAQPNDGRRKVPSDQGQGETMLNNPIIRILLLFLGCLFFLSFLERLWAPLPLIAVVFAGVTAVTLWMLAYERARLVTIYANPFARPVVDLVCQLCKEQPPVDGSPERQPSAPRETGTKNSSAGAESSVSRANGEKSETRLKLSGPADLAQAMANVKAGLLGHDDLVDRFADRLRENLRLRAATSKDTILPPLGVFLLAGSRGIGKRTFARLVSCELYQTPSLTAIDLDRDRAPIEKLTESVRRNPFQTIVVDGFDAAKPEFIGLLEVIVTHGKVQSGQPPRPVSFRHCLFFLISNRESEALLALKTSGDDLMLTSELEAVTAETALDGRIASLIDAVLPFSVPSDETQAEVVLMLMQQECRKYGAELTRVDPEVLDREVRSIQRAGNSFEATPGRIYRQLKGPILQALKHGGRNVSIHTNGIPKEASND